MHSENTKDRADKRLSIQNAELYVSVEVAQSALRAQAVTSRLTAASITAIQQRAPRVCRLERTHRIFAIMKTLFSKK